MPSHPQAPPGPAFIEQLEQQKKIIFLQAIHAFMEDIEIRRFADERSKKGVAVIMAALGGLQRHHFMGATGYTLATANQTALNTYLLPEHHINDFFRQMDTENNFKRPSEWNLQGVEKAAGLRMKRNVFNVYDTFRQLAALSALPSELKEHISNTLRDIAWRDPQGKAVTMDNITTLLSGAEVSGYLSQDRHWRSFRQDLNAAAAEKFGMADFVNALNRAAERSGLFNAIENLQKYIGGLSISCDWLALQKKLLTQWPQITSGSLNQTGPHRQRIAQLIETECGISLEMAENYLTNCERTMPLH